MRDGRRKAAEEWLKRDTHGDAERESSEKNDFQQTLLFGHLNHAPIAEEEEEEEKGKKKLLCHVSCFQRANIDSKMASPHLSFTLFLVNFELFEIYKYFFYRPPPPPTFCCFMAGKRC